MNDQLSAISTKYRTDKGPRAHNYTPIYHQYLRDLRGTKFNFLELGLGYKDVEWEGESLRMWGNYFWDANIYGVDWYDRSDLDGDRIRTFVGEQDDVEFYKREVFPVASSFKVIVDDCSHVHENTIQSLLTLFPHLEKGGYYFIEDVDTSYSPNHRGCPNWADHSAYTIMNYLFSLTHQLNLTENGLLTTKAYTPHSSFDGLQSIHFHKNLVLLRK